MVDVLLSTTASPTYFKSHKIGNNYYLDGGIYANNPSIVGIIEAKKNYIGPNKPHKNFSLLSVGNIAAIKDSGIKKKNYAKYWNLTKLPYLVDVAFNASLQNVHELCNLLKQSDDQYVRLEVDDKNLKISFDCADPKIIELLENKGQKVIDLALENQELMNNIKKFFDEKKTCQN